MPWENRKTVLQDIEFRALKGFKTKYSRNMRRKLAKRGRQVDKRQVRKLLKEEL